MNICWNLFNEWNLYSCHAVSSCSASFSILVVIEPMVGENSLRFRLRSLTLSNHSWYIRLRSGQAQHCTLSSLPAMTIHLEVVMWSKHELFWGLFGITDEEEGHFLLEVSSIKKWLWNLGLVLKPSIGKYCGCSSGFVWNLDQIHQKSMDFMAMYNKIFSTAILNFLN